MVCNIQILFTFLVKRINEEDDNNLTEPVKLDLLNKILDIEEEEIKIEEHNNIINTNIKNSIKLKKIMI